MKTKVIFKLLFNPWTKKYEVLALFPELAGDNNPYSTCLSYAHDGQHGSASVELSRLKPAKLDEYENLMYELIRIGYDLQIVKKFSRKMLQECIAQCNL